MTIEGIVEQGKHLGRKLGFPTANVLPERVRGEWPDNGVYVAALWIHGEGEAHLGMLNQGVHPTVPEGKPTVEIHLPGLHRELYGEEVRVEYLHFLRSERRFDGLEALQAQLARDLASVLDWRRAAQEAEAPDPEQRRAREIRWKEA